MIPSSTTGHNHTVPAAQATLDLGIAKSLLTVPEAASFLEVSEWVRGHRQALPLVRVGRLVRFDSFLLLRRFQGRQIMETAWEQERKKMVPQLQQCQQGCVHKRGKHLVVWYGMWREDVQKLTRRMGSNKPLSAGRAE